MKHYPIILITLLWSLTLFGCKKQEQETLTPKITENKVEATATTATFTWTVDWPGKLISVVEVSENEDMSNSKKYGPEIETENHNFTVTVSDLKAVTKYYYRFWVWNRYYEYNKFVMEGGDFATVETGVLNGVFSVSSSKKVKFSKGNLQYQASTKTWRLAEHQWDYVGTRTLDEYGYAGGTVNGSDNKRISSSYNGWIDLFGWGTSGFNHGANCYMPWSTSDDPDDYLVYGDYSNNLYDLSGKADWGYNAIGNGGNQSGFWQTLSKSEWNHLLNNRPGLRFAKANVNGVNGVILLPDNWNGSCCLNECNKGESNYNSNVVSGYEWESQLEANGAVFLPAGGERIGTEVDFSGGMGLYWSSSYESWLEIYGICFSDSEISAIEKGPRCFGKSVRLACPTVG